MRVCGVDLASQPAKTAVCRLRWGASPACESLDVGADDAAVVAAAVASDKCGVDAPLGWPDAFVDVVAGHHAGDEPVVPDSVEPLRLRATDVWVWRTHGRIPLSVSTDNIGVVALRGVRIQSRIARETDRSIDRRGDGLLVEVYPAAALHVWGLPASGYKRGPGAEVRRREILDGLDRRFAVSLTADQATTALAHHDALDALISAIVAALAATGGTTPPPDHLQAKARREGWIHVPVPPT